ncbi:MAG: transcriptional repressor LexA [Alphaproteobacteria bacterium]|nr:transcriptional repressor LexA [Alphaproteobacteria bacterium]
MLTRKQKDLLILIHERMNAGDIAPSYEEMRESVGLKSKSGIHRLIAALEDRGYLRRLPHKARAIEVIRLPEGYQNPLQNPPETVPAKAPAFPVAHAFESIPLYGKIAAGSPIEAIRDEGETIDIPPTLLGPGSHYALRVEGDSMINAGINDHDIVIIERAERAEQGQIVVALVDDNEVTLKRFRRAGNRIILEPENDNYEPWVLEPDRVKIQGLLVSLMRTYH